MIGDYNLNKDRYYLGTAWVNREHLRYVPDEMHPDECMGCCISDIEHNLPVLIKPEQLFDIVRESRVSENSLYHAVTHPTLILPQSLKLPCLHGYFRLKLAQNDPDLGPGHNQCLVDLYDACTYSGRYFSSSHLTKTAESIDLIYLRQHYKRHFPLSDGELYLRIRFYNRSGDEVNECKWKARLSESKSTKIDQILRNHWLLRILDQLEEFRALWPKFRLGYFPDIFAWGCYEVSVQIQSHCI
jgi:hypothetical protein